MTGTTSQEIAFWGQMETSLNLVLDQIQSEEVQMVFQILNQSNRFRLVMQFNTDADIEPRRKQAQNYNILLKDIPIKQLVESENIEGIATAVKKIFS